MVRNPKPLGKVTVADIGQPVTACQSIYPEGIKSRFGVIVGMSDISDRVWVQYFGDDADTLELKYALQRGHVAPWLK